MARFKQTDVVRAVKAARAAGLEVGSVKLTPDGAIVVMVDGTLKESEDSPFDQWKAKSDASAAKGTQSSP